MKMFTTSLECFLDFDARGRGGNGFSTAVDFATVQLRRRQLAGPTQYALFMPAFLSTFAAFFLFLRDSSMQGTKAAINSRVQ
jgi:hypothetical protein